MPMHDWTKVEAGVFHAFHHHWISAISDVLNSGCLPPEYYAAAKKAQLSCDTSAAIGSSPCSKSSRRVTSPTDMPYKPSWTKHVNFCNIVSTC
jgi:hypothetical protein